MSLSKQLGLGFFIVMLLVFIATLYMNIQNTKVFLQDQLNAHAQDTATSLGLSLSPHIGEENDVAVIETMVNAIFDRGYYQKITLTDADGKVIVNKSQGNTLKDIPPWFIDAFKINPPQAQSEINDAWSIKGNIRVTSNTGLGYQQLWKTALYSGIVALIGLFLALIFVWLLVKYVISAPISKVISQSQAISLQRFEDIKDVPRTYELKRIVNSFNLMSGKLNTMFKKLTNQSEEYRRYAYVDFVTGVGNRRAFELAMNSLLTNQNDRHEGYLFLIKASSLQSIHSQHGGEAGDKYLKDICNTIKETASSDFEHFSVFRINGGDFALVIENIIDTHAISTARSLAVNTKRLEKDEHKEGVAHIGATSFKYSLSLKNLMEKGDSALMIANESQNRWHILPRDAVSKSNEDWRTLLVEIMKSSSVDFVAQSVFSNNMEEIYSEWFARLSDPSTHAQVPMSQLIPASVRLDYAIDLDKCIVENVLTLINPRGQRVGLNLSRISILNADFRHWLIEKLHVYRSVCPKLIIEIPERALLHDIDSLITFAQTLKSFGIGICIEHFGAQLVGITHLRKLMPDFIKLDGRFTPNIQTEADNQLFLKSIIGIAQGLDIRIIAEKVETIEEQNWLLNNGADALQGYFIRQPKEVIRLT